VMPVDDIAPSSEVFGLAFERAAAQAELDVRTYNRHYCCQTLTQSHSVRNSFVVEAGVLPASHPPS
jgi:hypothetical protein